MKKDEVVTQLIEKGYNAENLSGVVMVYSRDISFTELGKLLQSLGYNASYGLQPPKTKENT